MSVDRSELHSLVDRLSDADLPVTRRLLQALVAGWDVAEAESEAEFTYLTRRDVEAAEAYFDQGGTGIAHDEVLAEIDRP
jgi:hypothetical protein